MVTRETLRKHRQAILEIARRYGAYDIRVFGSAARGEVTSESDLDLVVRFEPHRTLLDHGGLLMDLQDLLGVKVDIVDEEGMRPRFRQGILQETLPL